MPDRCIGYPACSLCFCPALGFHRWREAQRSKRILPFASRAIECGRVAILRCAYPSLSNISSVFNYIYLMGASSGIYSMISSTPHPRHEHILPSASMVIGSSLPIFARAVVDRPAARISSVFFIFRSSSTIQSFLYDHANSLASHFHQIQALN